MTVLRIRPDATGKPPRLRRNASRTRIRVASKGKSGGDLGPRGRMTCLPDRQQAIPASIFSFVMILLVPNKF